MIDFIIGGIVTYTLAALVGGWNALTKESPEQKYRREQDEALKRMMTDIDPITGDWTKRGTHERYSKGGVFIGIVEKRGGD